MKLPAGDFNAETAGFRSGIAMPVMTGLELAAKVATLPNAPPVILVSGYGHDSITPLQFPFLPKPFRPGQLAGLLGRLLPGSASPDLVH